MSLGKTLHSHPLSLHHHHQELYLFVIFYKWILVNLMLDVTLRRTSIPSRGVRHTPSHFMLQKPEISNCCIGGPLTQDLNADTFYMCFSSSWNTITSIYFIHLNKSLHLFEKNCTFVPLFNPNLDFLQAVKVTKSGHHLLHD